MKICSNCSKEFPETREYFYKRLDSLTASCKLCCSISCRKSSQKHREKRLKGSRDYYKNNRDYLLKQKKEYYINNKDNIKLRSKNYKVDLKKKSMTNYIWRKNNAQKIKDDKNKRFAIKVKDPIFKLKHNIRRLIAHAFFDKKITKGSKTGAIIGMTWVRFHKHLCETFELNYGIPREFIPWDEVHIDHIIPVCTASTEKEVLDLNHYTNLQLLFAEDNIEKRDKLDYVIP